jgi:prolyl 4-hydroxylase
VEDPTQSPETSYRSEDDASFAIYSRNLSSVLGDKQTFYNDFMEGCRKAVMESGSDPDVVCDKDDGHRMRMNVYQPQSVVNYTKTGFAKVKTPPEVFRLLKEFWDLNKEKSYVEWSGPTPYHNNWEVPPTVIRVDNTTLETGGIELQRAISNAAKALMEEWTGQRLSYSSVYGIRIYHNQSVLSPHVDRLPLVSSAIINVAQDVDEDWVLEVYDHDGVAHNVTMEPGDMVLYESHSVIHGRPFPLQGKFFANCFVHFEPLGPLDQSEISVNNGDLPPYLIPGSQWEAEYRLKHPDGWSVLSDPMSLIQSGDLPLLRYVGRNKPEVLHKPDKIDWRPIHEVCRQGNLEILKYLVEQDADIHAVTKAYGNSEPLDIAKRYLASDDPVIEYLEEKLRAEESDHSEL